MLAAGLPPAAGAADWSIVGSASQQISADSNRRLEGEPEPIYGTTSSLGLTFAALTPTTEWLILTGLTGAVFGGPGDTESLDRIDPNIATEIAHDGKYLDTGATLAFDMQPVAFAQIDDTGVTSGDATQISVRLGADAAYALDPRNSLLLGTTGRIVRFTDGTTSLRPTTTYGATLSWLRDLGPVTQANLGVGIRRFTAESDEDPESLTFDISTGFSHAVNRRLAVDAGVGLSATDTTRTIAGQRDSEFGLGVSGNLGVAWQPEPDTDVSFSFSHGLEPSSLGELRTTTTIAAAIQHVVSSQISAGLGVALQRRRSGGGFDSGTERDFVRLTPSVAFQITPDWALRAGYTLLADRENGDEALSNRVFLTVTRAFTILP